MLGNYVQPDTPSLVWILKASAGPTLSSWISAAPGVRSDVATFHNNMIATFNVFWAATRLGIKRIVAASSETVQGLPFDIPPPYIPVDEAYPPRPESV